MCSYIRYITSHTLCKIIECCHFSLKIAHSGGKFENVPQVDGKGAKVSFGGDFQVKDGKVHRCPVSRGRLFFPIFCFNFRLVPIVYICCDFLYCTLRHMFFLHKFTSFISDKNWEKRPKNHAPRETGHLRRSPWGCGRKRQWQFYAHGDSNCTGIRTYDIAIYDINVVTTDWKRLL